MNTPSTPQPEIDRPAVDVPLPPGPWLVFARHPGEEISALGGSLIRARLSAETFGSISRVGMSET